MLLYIGEDAVENETEADSNDVTECPHDDQPTSGIFVSFFLCICHVCIVCLLLYSS